MKARDPGADCGCTIGALVLSAALLPSPAAADGTHPEAPVSEGGTYSFTFENDIFAGDVKNCTDGLPLDYTSPRNDLPYWARFARRNLRWLTDVDERYATDGLGQNIYTSADISCRDTEPDDRPYAGFAYGSMSVAADRGDGLDTIALDLGVVGPAAQADPVHSFVHRLIGTDDPKGWDSQLRIQSAFRLLYERNYRLLYNFELALLDLEVDAARKFSVALGIVDISAGAGMTLRIGDRLWENYGPPRVRPAVASPGFFRSTGGFGWYLFAGAEARIVDRNIFIEGNTYKSGPGVEPEILIGDLQARIALHAAIQPRRANPHPRAAEPRVRGVGWLKPIWLGQPPNQVLSEWRPQSTHVTDTSTSMPRKDAPSC